MRIKYTITILLVSIILPTTIEAMPAGYQYFLVEIIAPIQKKQREALIIIDQKNNVYLEEKDIQFFKIANHCRHLTPINVKQRAFFLTTANAGLKTTYHAQDNQLKLMLQPQCLTPHTHDFHTPKTALPDTTTTLSGFMNYNLVTQTNQNHTAFAAHFEQIAAKDYWYFKNDVSLNARLRQNIFTRLNTSLHYENPETMRILQIGDMISKPSSWTLPTRMGGILYSKEYRLNPEFITFPTQDIEGQAEIPSTLDVYINDLLRYSEKVDGPFSLQNLPTMSGFGETKLVLKDILGNKIESYHPFYTHKQLLKPGLADYMIAAGFERKNFSRKNFDYSQPLIAGQYLYGLNQRMTIEYSSEISSKFQNMGIGVIYGDKTLGTINTTIAASHNPEDRKRDIGYLLQLGYEYFYNKYSVNLSLQNTSPEFTQSGINKKTLQQINCFAGYRLNEQQSISAQITHRNFLETNDQTVTSLHYRLYLDDIGWLSISGFHAHARQTNTGIEASLTIPLNQNSESLRVNTGYQQNDVSAFVEWQKNQFHQNSFSYRTQIGYKQEASLYQTVSYKGDYGDTTGNIVLREKQQQLRLQQKGAISFLEGIHISPPISSGFTLITTDTNLDKSVLEKIPVLKDNLLYAYLDKAPFIIPRIRAHEANTITIGAKHLPLNATLDQVKKTIIPHRYTGHKLKFSLKEETHALVRLRNYQEIGILPGMQIETPKGDKLLIASQGKVFIHNVVWDTPYEVKLRQEQTSCYFVLPQPQPLATGLVYHQLETNCSLDTL